MSLISIYIFSGHAYNETMYNNMSSDLYKGDEELILSYKYSYIFIILSVIIMK